MMRKNKNSVLFFLLLIACNVFSQQFHHAADLGAVSNDSFYSIPINPELSSYLKTDLSDIRIIDEKGKWVPHLVQWPQKNNTFPNVLSDLPVVSRNDLNTASVIVVRSEFSFGISKLHLISKNTTATRRAVVSGSDDGKQWFTITDSIILSDPQIPLLDQDQPTFIINFPRVNYQYFKVTIYNGNKDPFYLQKVMTKFEVPFNWGSTGLAVQNPPLTFLQTDTVGYTLVKVESQEPYHFNNFKVIVKAPKYYGRRVKLFMSEQGTYVKDFIFTTPEYEYFLSTGNENSNEMPGRMKAKAFYLLIENRDNPPLQLTAIATEQISKRLVAYLEKGKQYKLMFNDSVAIAPDYDLEKFLDRIPDVLPVLKVGKIFVVVKEVEDTTKVSDNKKWLWPVLIIILLLLGAFTWSLTKDLKKGNKTE